MASRVATLGRWIFTAFSGALAVSAVAANVPPGLQPPGGLEPDQTPQIIVMTFDDAVTASTFETVQSILTNRCNPNGTPVQATFFVSMDWTDYARVQRLYAAGHEIALHTMTHTTGTNTDLATWRAEIAGCRRTLSRLARIPLEDIRGFRAPFLQYSHESFYILNEQGLTYDASICERPGRLSQSASQMLWPYTLDNGVAQDCWTGTPPQTNIPGLFEMPLWSLYDTNTSECVTMDPSGSDAQVLALLQYNFLARYNGNRAPLGIFLHADLWSGRTQVLRDFLDWAQTYADVWVVSLSALAAFMQNPQAAAAAGAFSPFITVTRPSVPDSEIVTLSFPQGTVRTCGERPPAYPAPDTVYWVWAPLAGGRLHVEVSEQWQTGFNARVVLSNGAPAKAGDWQASFEIEGGSITWWSSGIWQIEGSRVVVKPSSMDTLAAGATKIIMFGGTRYDTLAFLSPSLALYAAGPQKPEFQTLELLDDGRVRLSWDDAGFGYRVEQTTNGVQGAWYPLGDVHGRTCWTGAVPANVSTWLYRLQIVP